MDKKSFRAWLDKTSSDTTEDYRDAIVSRCDRICRHEIDLDEAFERGQLCDLYALFSYSAEDERLKVAPKHHVPIEGGIGGMTGALRRALKKYMDYRGVSVVAEVVGDGKEDEEDSLYNDEERPFSASEIDIDNKEITVFSILERLKSHEITLTPDYQRNDGLWKRRNQSQLIESMLLGIPLPAFYFAIDKDFVDELGLKRQRWQVVDGLQRLCAIRNFMVGEPAQTDRSGHVIAKPRVMRLEEMEYLKSLNGKSYEELPDALKRTLLEVNLKANIIRRSTPRAVKLNIFRRLNTGGMPLSMQEIRHAMHSPGAAPVLKEMSETEIFKTATQDKVYAKRMGDCEYANRFLAFYLLGIEKYEGMDAFLDESLDLVDEWAKDENEGRRRIKDLKDSFCRALDVIWTVLGTNSFVRLEPLRTKTKDTPSRINKALFEVFTVCAARLSEKARLRYREKADEARKEYVALFVDEGEGGLSDLVATTTGRTSRVRQRYELVSAYFQKLTGEQIEWRKGLYD